MTCRQCEVYLLCFRHISLCIVCTILCFWQMQITSNLYVCLMFLLVVVVVVLDRFAIIVQQMLISILTVSRSTIENSQKHTHTTKSENKIFFSSERKTFQNVELKNILMRARAIIKRKCVCGHIKQFRTVCHLNLFRFAFGRHFLFGQYIC